jgi:hypothetical protein
LQTAILDFNRVQVKTAVLGLETVNQLDAVGKNCSFWTGDGTPIGGGR